MILEAKHHPVIYPLFRGYSRLMLKLNFREIKIIGDFQDRHLPLLVIANHVGWWDGFWIEYLNTKVFRRKFHFMMLEEQLRKFWFFNYTGGFSVRRNSVSILETIKYTARLLSGKDNMVLLFPQGEIYSMYRGEFVFQKGLERILKEIANDIQVVFVANLTDYFASPKPTVFAYIKTIGADKSADVSVIQQHYNEFYLECSSKQGMITI
jgi:1-acyl-sn-glycerol-3-phosphate acyltransferase